MVTTTGRITKTPGVCEGDACVAEHRIPVWKLVKQHDLGASDEQLLERFPGLAPEDLQAAWEYTLTHPEEVGQAVRRKETPEEWTLRLRRWATNRRVLPSEIDDSRERMYEGRGE